jgi:hypothetical protein
MCTASLVLPTPHRLYHTGNDLPQDRRRAREIQARETDVLGAECFAKI